MNVGLMIGSAGIGGTERQAMHLARGFAAAGVPVTVYLDGRPRGPFLEAKRLFGRGVCVRFLWQTRYTKAVSALRLGLFLRLQRATVLHVLSPTLLDLGFYGTRLAGTPDLIGSVRNVRYPDDPAYHPYLRKNCGRCRAITANCESIRESLVRNHLCNPDSVTVINNGIPMPSVGDGPPGRSPAGRPTALFAGHLKERKAPQIFVRAALTVLKHIPDARFVIAGDGPLDAACRKLAQEAGATESFEFVGSLQPSEVPYAEANVVVSTSLAEGSSNTLLEGLAHGVPVVATDVGGARDIVGGMAFGRVAAANDVDAIAAGMLDFMTMGLATLKSVSAAARSRVQEDFSIDGLVQHHLALYRNRPANRNPVRFLRQREKEPPQSDFGLTTRSPPSYK